MTRSRARPRIAILSILVASGWMAPGRAAQVDVLVRKDGSTIVVTARASVEADAGTAWRVLTDYARYPEFVPGVRDCRVVRRDGTQVTVEQSGSAFLGLAQLPFDATYEITERAPEELWSSAAVPPSGRLDSHYRLTRRDARVELDYSGTLAVRIPILLPMEEAAARQTIARQFQALADRIEREHAGRAWPVAADPRPASMAGEGRR